MGIINTTYEAIEWMSISKNGRGGLIVNISSIAGIRFSTHVPIYCASKHGVLGFTKSMAVSGKYFDFKYLIPIYENLNQFYRMK